MFWKEWILDIKEKTSAMDGKDARSYVLAYYWPHILIAVSATALVLLFGWHYLFGNKKPAFTCVIVNQGADAKRDARIAQDYADTAGLSAAEVVLDSDYMFSYGELELPGVNESSYDKFFFQWGNGELDAVILPESFYRYCRELGGGFCLIEDTGSFEAYQEAGACRAAVLGECALQEKACGQEKLLFAIPETAKHPDKAARFLEYLQSSEKKEKEDGL